MCDNIHRRPQLSEQWGPNVLGHSRLLRLLTLHISQYTYTHWWWPVKVGGKPSRLSILARQTPALVRRVGKAGTRSRTGLVAPPQVNHKHPSRAAFELACEPHTSSQDGPGPGKRAPLLSGCFIRKPGPIIDSSLVERKFDDLSFYGRCCACGHSRWRH